MDILEILAKSRLANASDSSTLISRSFLIECIKCMNQSFYFPILNRNSLCLADQLTELLLLYCSYEISVMLANSVYFEKQIVSDLIIISDAKNFLILSEDPAQLYVWKKYMMYFLKSNDVNHDSLLVKKTLLCQGLIFKGCFVSLNHVLSISFLIVRPSLEYQFVLMDKIAYILARSISRPLFVLIIRLNKLLLVWSFFHKFQNTKKIFLLLDYVIHVKLRLFMRSRFLTIFSEQTKIKVLTGYQENSIIFTNKISRTFKANAYDIFYYKQYLLIKLAWLLLFSRHINSRKAI